MRSYLSAFVFLGSMLPASAGAASIRETVKSWERHRTDKGVLIVQDAKTLSSWSEQAIAYRLHCPSPQGLYDEGENATGFVFRLDCRSPNGAQRWSLRVVIREGANPLIMPW